MTQVMTRHGWLAPACRCNPNGLVHPQCCYGMREEGIMHLRCCGGDVVSPEVARPPTGGLAPREFPVAPREQLEAERAWIAQVDAATRRSPFERRARAGQLPVNDITGHVAPWR